MAEPARAGPRYRAFLSYSHKDADEAARIHRRLESYRLPRRLAGRETDRGQVPARLWPIFRDREELAASADLSETVRAALEQSDALIVLCSPAAAASLWVAEEIATFRRLHPDRPVLAAIIAGDPPACFPASLRSRDSDGAWHEPLATDLRRQGDGPHLGLLKLVAGITGVALDDLAQRDATRRIRRVMAVTAGALVAVLIMAALTVVALGARREADRQRAEAEGLIEFMLTDLRERLRGVGRLDALTAVNERALAYYRDQEDFGELEAESLLRRARILHAMGEDDVARGNLGTALAAFREAHRITSAMLARASQDPETVFVHAQSDYWVGRIHELRGNWIDAAQQYRLYASAGNHLVRLNPRNPNYMMEAGWGAQNLGVVHLNGLGDPAAAAGLFDAASVWFGRAGAAMADDTTALREQANAFAWLADSYYARRLWQPSLDARQRQYRITDRLYRRDPTNVELTFRMAIAERSVGRLMARTGELDNVRPLLMKAHDRALWLTERDPRNAEWLLLRVKIACDLLAPNVPQHRETNDEALRRSLATGASILRSQGHPGLADVRNCLERFAPRTST